MRRALGLVALVVVGVLIGFLIRLVWPGRDRTPLAGYDVPAPGVDLPR